MRTAIRSLLAVVCLASSAFASIVSLTGSLNPDDANDVLAYTFTLVTTGDVTFQSYGYGGGVNGNGAVIGAGGFDPYLSIFTGSGDGAMFLASNDDGDCPPGNPELPCADPSLTLTGLAAGDYTLVLSVFDNFSFAENYGSGTLGDGFIGLGTYYDGRTDSDRTSDYALDVSSQSFAPEPGTWVLFVSGLGLLALGTRGRKGTKR